MKTLFATLYCIAVSCSCIGQTFNAYSLDGRTLIEGGKTLLKIENQFADLRQEVAVSNGEIERGITTRYVVRNKQQMTAKDTVYFWEICEGSKGFEHLYVNYFKQDSLVHADTLSFAVKDGPILSCRAFKESTGESYFDFEMYKNVTPKNIIGIEVEVNSPSYGANSQIIDYRIEIYKKNRIVKTLVNTGSYLSDENKRILSSMKKGEVRINSINAQLECGLPLEVKDVEPIVFP